MAQLTVKQYDSLEDAIAHGTRLSVWRRGTEYLIIPKRLHMVNRRECIDAQHPSTGARLTLWVDELDTIEAMH